MKSFLFSYPDYHRRHRSFTDSTLPKERSRAVTAGRELHPALKSYVVSGANITKKTFAGTPAARNIRFPAR